MLPGAPPMGSLVDLRTTEASFYNGDMVYAEDDMSGHFPLIPPDDLVRIQSAEWYGFPKQEKQWICPSSVPLN